MKHTLYTTPNGPCCGSSPTMYVFVLPAVLLVLVPSAVSGHGSVSIPPPRQAIDGTIAPWNGSVPSAIPFMFWCAVPDAGTDDPRNVTGRNGQACFWFNNVRLLHPPHPNPTTALYPY